MNPIDEEEPADLVLVYLRKPEFFDDEDGLRRYRSLERLRTLFEDAMFREGLKYKESHDEKYAYVKVHCPFQRLCQQAEIIKLEMPLKVKSDQKEGQEHATKVISMLFKIDEKPSRYLSAPFRTLIADQFLGYDSPDLFFRTAQRSLLVSSILNRINIRDKLADPDESSATDKGLAYMLMKKAYTDYFMFHDRTRKSESRRNSLTDIDLSASQQLDAARRVSLISTTSAIDEDEDFESSARKGTCDTRAQLSRTWVRLFKKQPLWQVRNYFGEKIAFYFAWEGTLISSLIIPAILGVIIFGVGVPVAIKQLNYGEAFLNGTSSNSVSAHISYYLEVIKIACDNIVTPWFAFIVCLWGTIFLELWKRVRATQSFRWGVDHFHETEPTRPEFQPTHVRHDPVLNTTERYYPAYLRAIKYIISACVSIFMIIVVLASVTAVILLRLYVVTDYCPKNEVCQFTLATLAPAILNTVSILILGKIYSYIAEVLTDWENHRTESEYNSALIIKLFAFQFANTYASLFYLAFIRGRYADFSFLNLKYVDQCCENNCHGAAATSSGNCMSMLTFQVLVLMIVKPFPRFFKDIIVPAVKKCFRSLCGKNKVASSSGDIVSLYRKEMRKPNLSNFTREELTEKIVMYGFLLLFAASFPLAPLIALITITADMRIDAQRLLWWNRRPLAYRNQGIGIWFDILRFVNLCGVISNGLLIAFTSLYAKEKSSVWKLTFFILFEHAVFGFRFIITQVIPDVPQQIKEAQRKEKALVTQTLIEGMKNNFENHKTYGKDADENADENDNNDSDSSSHSTPVKPVNPVRASIREKYKHLYQRF